MYFNVLCISALSWNNYIKYYIESLKYPMEIRPAVPAWPAWRADESNGDDESSLKQHGYERYCSSLSLSLSRSLVSVSLSLSLSLSLSVSLSSLSLSPLVCLSGRLSACLVGVELI